MSESVKNILLIEPHYLPSLAWMKLASRYEKICFDLGEHHIKSSYRNRCHILGPNGILHLSVPLLHGKGQKTTTGNVRISYAEDWRKNHLTTIMSCYRRAAFYEYFADMFEPVYHEKHDRLIDLNLACIRIIFRICKYKQELLFSDTYIPPGTAGYDDFRNRLRPGRPNGLKLQHPKYTQVFSDRFGFFEDLSSIDYIFNQGNTLNQ